MALSMTLAQRTGKLLPSIWTADGLRPVAMSVALGGV
jgi:hypothetical protein